jgi:hypothetical protein
VLRSEYIFVTSATKMPLPSTLSRSADSVKKERKKSTMMPGLQSASHGAKNLAIAQPSDSQQHEKQSGRTSPGSKIMNRDK